MKDFSEIKKEIYSFVAKDPSRESKYGKFLNILVRKYDLRGEDEQWDLWYFSDNTEFCRDSARRFLEEVRNLVVEYERHVRSEPHSYSFDDLRRRFGCFCFYLYAALESFAHEVNIFYGILKDRQKVSITTIGNNLRENSTLKMHLETSLQDPSIRRFIDYRNAIMHGYVFPISGKADGLFLKKEPKLEKFAFEGFTDQTVLEFCELSYERVSTLLCEGWRCFEIDELSD